MSTMSRSWMPSYIDSRITRRRLLKGTAAGAGAAFLIACGGDGSSSLQSASNALEPGAVWAAKDTWKLEDETKKAVRGGIYRGVRSGDQSGHFDFITLASSESVSGHHTNEHLMAAARRPGLRPQLRGSQHRHSRPGISLGILARRDLDHFHDARRRQVARQTSGERSGYGHR